LRLGSVLGHDDVAGRVDIRSAPASLRLGVFVGQPTFNLGNLNVSSGAVITPGAKYTFFHSFAYSSELVNFVSAAPEFRGGGSSYPIKRRRPS